MSDGEDNTAPDGFELMPSGIGFTDQLSPCYIRRDPETVSVGLHVTKKHANTMGICHGGVLMTLADIGAATAIHVAMGKLVAAPTVNIAVDFQSAAPVGQWIETESQVVTLKRRFAFSSGLIVSAKGIVARFNGTFYLPDHDGMFTDAATGRTALGKLASSD